MGSPPLDLIIRFSTSHPDIVLPVAKPSTITCLSLKQLLRAELPPPASESRLRLIHAGKVLPDAVALSTTLHITPPLLPDHGEPKSEKARGKQPVRDLGPPAARVYIHCSIGDVVAASELTAEAKAAAEADAALASNIDVTGRESSTSEAATTTTTPAPRGFDRLLNTGFTPAEITALRTQFLAIQSHAHTPDTMPSAAQLLELEERWLDNTSSSATAGTNGAAIGEDSGGFGAEDAGALEDMLWGNLMGFFWPVGAMFWLMREEGVWSRRRQVAVLSGFLVNLCFGGLRIMN